jgi:hypothetical protein
MQLISYHAPLSTVTLSFPCDERIEVFQRLIVVTSSKLEFDRACGHSAGQSGELYRHT